MLFSFGREDTTHQNAVFLFGGHIDFRKNEPIAFMAL